MKAKNSTPIEERVRREQSTALGDTGDGITGVPSDEQGISNRPGDLDSLASPASVDGNALAAIDEPDDDLEDDDAEDDDEDDEDDDEDEDEDEDESDPEAEPGKPL
jgi:hypothetical protein